MDFIYEIDLNLFILLNQTLINPLFDVMMPFVTKLKNWSPAVLAFIAWIFYKERKKGFLILLFFFVAITVSDQFSSSFLKPFFGRLRPCVALEDVRLLVGKKSSLSFPSSHAVNMATFATYFLFFFPRLKYWLAGLAIMIGYSRIYIGVHYPFDVLTGFVVGITIGYLFMRLYHFTNNRIKLMKQGGETNEP